MANGRKTTVTIEPTCIPTILQLKHICHSITIWTRQSLMCSSSRQHSIAEKSLMVHRSIARIVKFVFVEQSYVLTPVDHKSFNSFISGCRKTSGDLFGCFGPGIIWSTIETLVACTSPVAGCVGP
ncbi:hypothetical protein YC2023_043463 [Brassica napus]